MKKVYLILYNFFCYCGFLYVETVLGITFLKDGVEAFATAYESVGNAMFWLQILQSLEVIHSILGLTKGSKFASVMQFIGRSFVLFVIILPEERIYTSPFVFYLFLTWSAIEIVRWVILIF